MVEQQQPAQQGQEEPTLCQAFQEEVNAHLPIEPAKPKGKGIKQPVGYPGFVPGKTPGYVGREASVPVTVSEQQPADSHKSVQFGKEEKKEFQQQQGEEPQHQGGKGRGTGKGRKTAPAKGGV